MRVRMGMRMRVRMGMSERLFELFFHAFFFFFKQYRVITEKHHESAAKIQMGFHKRSVEDLIGHALAWLQHPNSNTNNNNNNNNNERRNNVSKEDFDWAALVTNETYFKRTPSLQFM